MRFLNYINEEFGFGFKSPLGYVEVWKNPIGGEVKEAAKEYVRWAIYKDDMYVWDAEKASHMDIANFFIAFIFLLMSPRKSKSV